MEQRARSSHRADRWGLRRGDLLASEMPDRHTLLPTGRNRIERMGRAINIDDFRRRAERRLPKMVFDYLEGGAEDEYCLQHNLEVLRSLRFLPKRMRDVASPDSSIELFDRKCPAPFLIGPTGLNGVLWPGGDIALARAAAKASIPFVLSTPAQNSIEEVADKAGGELWFQLYDINRKLTRELVERASRSGYKALVLTVDVPANGRRERDLRNGFVIPFQYTPKVIWDGVRHPSWAWQFLRHGMPVMANLVTSAESNTQAAKALASRRMNAALSWEDLRELRTLWPHNLLVKGVLDPADAILCTGAGVNGIILSNHGGRQLDSAASPVEVLPRIASQCRAPLLIDGGFRRGSDIVKAIALGAKAVLLGRAVLYGLAADGESGATEVIAMLQEEIGGTLAQIGCASICSLTPEYLLPSS